MLSQIQPKAISDLRQTLFKGVSKNFDDSIVKAIPIDECPYPIKVDETAVIKSLKHTFNLLYYLEQAAILAKGIVLTDFTRFIASLQKKFSKLNSFSELFSLLSSISTDGSNLLKNLKGLFLETDLSYLSNLYYEATHLIKTSGIKVAYTEMQSFLKKIDNIQKKHISKTVSDTFDKIRAVADTPHSDDDIFKVYEILIHSNITVTTSKFTPVKNFIGSATDLMSTLTSPTLNIFKIKKFLKNLTSHINYFTSKEFLELSEGSSKAFFTLFFEKMSPIFKSFYIVFDRIEDNLGLKPGLLIKPLDKVMELYFNASDKLMNTAAGTLKLDESRSHFSKARNISRTRYLFRIQQVLENIELSKTEEINLVSVAELQRRKAALEAKIPKDILNELELKIEVSKDEQLWQFATAKPVTFVDQIKNVFSILPINIAKILTTMFDKSVCDIFLDEANRLKLTKLYEISAHDLPVVKVLKGLLNAIYKINEIFNSKSSTDLLYALRDIIKTFKSFKTALNLIKQFPSSAAATAEFQAIKELMPTLPGTMATATVDSEALGINSNDKSVKKLAQEVFLESDKPGIYALARSIVNPDLADAVAHEKLIEILNAVEAKWPKKQYAKDNHGYITEIATGSSYDDLKIIILNASHALKQLSSNRNNRERSYLEKLEILAMAFTKLEQALEQLLEFSYAEFSSAFGDQVKNFLKQMHSYLPILYSIADAIEDNLMLKIGMLSGSVDKIQECLAQLNKSACINFDDVFEQRIDRNRELLVELKAEKISEQETLTAKLTDLKKLLSSSGPEKFKKTLGLLDLPQTEKVKLSEELQQPQSESKSWFGVAVSFCKSIIFTPVQLKVKQIAEATCKQIQQKIEALEADKPLMAIQEARLRAREIKIDVRRREYLKQKAPEVLKSLTEATEPSKSIAMKTPKSVSTDSSTDGLKLEPVSVVVYKPSSQKPNKASKPTNKKPSNSLHKLFKFLKSAAKFFRKVTQKLIKVFKKLGGNSSKNNNKKQNKQRRKNRRIKQRPSVQKTSFNKPEGSRMSAPTALFKEKHQSENAPITQEKVVPEPKNSVQKQQSSLSL